VDERREVLELIAGIVKENYEVGRRSFGASIKPELRKRTFNRFSEQRLGFRGFSDVLVAAQQANLIDLYPAPRGPDKEAVPPGEPALSQRVEDDAEVGFRGRVRQDLWKAVVDWNEGWLRVYDRSADEAVMLPATATSFEPTRFVAIRSQIKSEAERFVDIEPVPMDQQIDWMREFAATVTDEYPREILGQALESERPAREFTRVLSAHPRLRGAWRVFRIRKVHRRIEEWAKTNGLDELAVFEHEHARAEDVSDSRIDRGERVASDNDRVERLRALAHRAVNRMPESELLALRLPLEYLAD
jgi:hypothetical protein